MIAEEYLRRSRLFRRLKSGPHGQLVELYATRLVRDGLARRGTWRCLHVVGDLLSWMARSRAELTDLDERMIERYLRHRAGKQSLQPGDRAALKRLLSVLREAGTIAPTALPPMTPRDRIFEEFGDYLRRERGLAPKSIIRHLPIIRRFLGEVCPAGASDLGKITQEDVTRYIEHHARDWSPGSGKAMCWSLRAFLGYLHHRGLNPLTLAGCVPSIRRWKLASLPTYLSARQVQQVLDGCDRTTAIGRRDYAILLMLARLGLRAGEIVTLTLDDIGWRSGEMLVRAKGRQRARMPMPPDVGVAVVAYLRDGRPTSSCRRLFLRTLAPHTGFASGCAITMIARTALERAGIRGYAHQGAHIFRHSLATELLRSGATLSEIGQLLRHESHDTTRIYAKVDIEALRRLSLPLAGRCAMSGLRSALERYLSMRQGLGYKYQHQARRLAGFISFMEKRRATTITTKLAMSWATLPPDRHASWALRLTDVRGFARHVANADPKTEVPPTGMLPRLRRAKPYVYSDAEIQALLAAALTLPPAKGLRRWTYHHLFGLIAVTGMRLSEAIGLQRGDVDLDEGVLTVRQSKFGKSRLVPLHPTVRQALLRYAERRDAHLGSRCGPHFFVAERGGRLLHQYVHRVFWRLSREIGLRRPGDHSGPRVHDFRHGFAIRTLLGLYREGSDVERQLPVLSTYLGHACVRDTYWYLSACPELMEEAARRLDRRWEAKR